MEFKGTKAPWKQVGKKIQTSSGELVPMPTHFSTSPRTEEEVFGDNEEWQKAKHNLKLIASAPELLETLLGLLRRNSLRKVNNLTPIDIGLINGAINKALK